MSNSVDPDEMAHYELSHLDLCCLKKPIIIACGNERVKGITSGRFFAIFYKGDDISNFLSAFPHTTPLSKNGSTLKKGRLFSHGE